MPGGPQAGCSTATGQAIFNALSKRLSTQGHIVTDHELLTLTIDIMAAITANSANATTHAGQETAANPVRPFILGV